MRAERPAPDFKTNTESGRMALRHATRLFFMADEQKMRP